MGESDSRVFVDEQYLAERFGLSRRYWQLLRQRGEGPIYYSVGRRRLYCPLEVEQWLREHRVESTDEN
jgi:hypothetical protein